ncbi:hypothetical protein WR25_06221 [Diploscapter pachys]|uniref:Transcription factor AP-2 C-terminal domain-containing protein n=1 Tax=Diploscapter pachys TaxID=2018661 RepID=A0A2A2M0H0_9BILA|nr:hypothetical protein WR25_06221 [Diploscapter pachys]
MNSTAINEAPDSTRKESEDVNEAEREEGEEEVEQRPFSPTDPSEFFVMDDDERHEEKSNAENDVIGLDVQQSNTVQQWTVHQQPSTTPMHRPIQPPNPSANAFNLKSFPTQPQYSQHYQQAQFNPRACSTPIQPMIRRTPLGEVNPNIDNNRFLPSQLYSSSAQPPTPIPSFGVYDKQSIEYPAGNVPIRSLTPSPFRRNVMHPYQRQNSAAEFESRPYPMVVQQQSLSHSTTTISSPSSYYPHTNSSSSAYDSSSHSIQNHPPSHSFPSTSTSSEETLDESHQSVPDSSSNSPVIYQQQQQQQVQSGYVFDDKNGLKIAAHFGQRGLHEEFEQVTGRLCLMSGCRRYKVTVGEILRRVREPETMHLSLVSGLLRKGKCSNASKELQSKLEKVGLHVPSGRRKSFGITTFTALCEEEAIHMADDFRKLILEMNTGIMARCLIGVNQNGENSVAQPKPEECMKFINRQLEGARWFIDLMSSVYNGVSNRPAEMSPPRNAAEHFICNFNLLTHGFGHNAVKSVLTHLRSMTDEMAKALGTVPVIPQRSTLQQTPTVMTYPAMPTMPHHMAFPVPPSGYFPSPSPAAVSVPSTPTPSSSSPFPHHSHSASPQLPQHQSIPYPSSVVPQSYSQQNQPPSVGHSNSLYSPSTPSSSYDSQS